MDRTIEKRRAANSRPICPTCGKDLKRSYIYERQKGESKGKWIATGWECSEDQYKEWT